MSRRGLIIVLCCCWTLLAQANNRDTIPYLPKQYPDTTIYQGMSIKLDIATPILEIARSGGKVQGYEMALNVRLAKRFYPTVEFGYALANVVADAGHYTGQGGFARLGMDLSAIKKGTGDNCLMVGLRVAGAYQGFQITDVPVYGDYWEGSQTVYFNQRKFDCWGEIVAGCQVQIWKGFQMGWYVRLKLLFTRTDQHGNALPAYLPGYGYRNDTNWGLNYFLGYKF